MDQLGAVILSHAYEQIPIVRKVLKLTVDHIIAQASAQVGGGVGCGYDN
jgi:hypothetical protein